MPVASVATTPPTQPWYRGKTGLGAAVVGLVLVVALLAPRGGPPGNAGTSNPPTILPTQAAVVPPTATPAPTPTKRPTLPPATPTPEPTEVDPDVAYFVWTTAFGDTWDELSGDVADALETDYYWIDSIDQTRYDAATNRIVIEATVLFESVYAYDREEWQTDTWDLYQDWSRDVWNPFVDAFDGGMDEEVNFTPDWPRWTPTLVFRANAGRLRTECPGSLIYAVSQRNASQSDFLDECTFKN